MRRFWWLLFRRFDKLYFNQVLFELQWLRLFIFMVYKIFYFLFYCFGLNPWSVCRFCMSHYHLFSCKYFPSHFNRFLLSLKVDIFLVEVRFIISGSWLSFESLFFDLISRTVLFDKIHVFWSFEHFGEIDINFISVSQVNKITGTTWFWSLLKLSFETQLLPCLNNVNWVWYIFFNWNFTLCWLVFSI